MTTASPLVSIVTCTYNRAHLVGDTIQSVLSQTWQNLEYIIVDDGSTDNTAEVVKSFHDDRIQYYFHARTLGHLSRLRNFAHQQCRGEFIAYIDSDDVWEPGKLTAQMAGFTNDSVGFSFTDILTFNESGVISDSLYRKPVGPFTGSVFPEMLSNRLIICHTTLVVRTTALDVTGPMDEEMHSGDHDLVFFLSRYFNAFVIYQPLVRVRKHDQNSTSNNELNLRLLREHHRTLQKLRDRSLISEKEYRHALAITSYSFGHQLLNAKLPREARHYFLMSFGRRPWHAKSALMTLYALAIEIVG